MTKTITEKPDEYKTYKCGKWHITYYPLRNEVHCISPFGVIHIIKLSTYNISGVPNYVKRYLEKQHLLDQWREAQIQQALDRLATVRKRLENMKEKPISEIQNLIP